MIVSVERIGDAENKQVAQPGRQKRVFSIDVLILFFSSLFNVDIIFFEIQSAAAPTIAPIAVPRLLDTVQE